MQPKVELNRVRNVGEIIDDSILFFKQNRKPLFKSYFIICGFFWVAGLIISILNQSRIFLHQELGESIYSITYFCTLLFGFINFIFITLTSLSFITLYHEKGKEAPDVEEVWGYVKYYLLRIFGSSLLLIIFCAIGTVFCLLPGIYLTPVSMLIISVMIFENTTFGYAFNHAFRLIKNNWWPVFGTLIATTMIVFSATLLLIIPVVIIVSVISFSTTLNTSHVISMATAITLSSLQFLYLLPAISVALIYFSLTEQQGDNSLLKRIEMLGKHKTDSSQLPTEEY